MSCELCGAKMKERIAAADDPYRYLMSGLKNVYLEGITVRTCSGCKAESPIIPRIPELHTLIADWLIKKPDRLTGEEIRFLRKEADLSAKRFAALLRIDPAYLSRIEKGHHKHLGFHSDQLARLYVMESRKEYSQNTIKAIADARIEANASNSKPRQRSLFRLFNNQWKSTAA